MKIDKKALKNILNSHAREHENHAKKLLQRSRLETQDFTLFAAASFEKTRAVTVAFLGVLTSHFAKIYFCIGFVQQVAALLHDRIRILLQQVAGEKVCEKICASITCTIRGIKIGKNDGTNAA